jgi:replicative DNA helicase
LSNEELRHAVLRMLRPDDYEDLPTAAIFGAMLGLERDGTSIDFESLSRKLQDDSEASRMLPQLVMSSSLHASNEDYAPEECIYTFRLMKVDQRIEELRSELNTAEREGDSNRVSEIAAEQVSLTRLRSTLRPADTTAASGFD